MNVFSGPLRNEREGSSRADNTHHRAALAGVGECVGVLAPWLDASQRGGDKECEGGSVFVGRTEAGGEEV